MERNRKESPHYHRRYHDEAPPIHRPSISKNFRQACRENVLHYLISPESAVEGFVSVHYSSERMDWETPQALFDEYDREFHFTLDVCATPLNAKCERYFTPAMDGLAHDWDRQICWMNPPYGREIRAWMQAAYESSLDGATVVCLVPSRTDTRWWHDYAMKGEIRFLRGRIKFDGHKKDAPFASAIVVFRPAQMAKAVA